MYTDAIKRIQIYIEESMDELLTRYARRARRSKAELIREAIRRQFSEPPTDPFDAWAGGIDEDPGGVDELVYGR